MILRHSLQALALLLLGAVASCGGPEEQPAPADPAETSAELSPVPAGEGTENATAAPAPTPGGLEEGRPLTEEEQAQVIDAILQAKARQQAEGLGKGRVRVNGAWPYSGYSYLAPDPNAAIEARLVAVDVTVSGHTEHFDFDDIEIVDGATFVSYGSDPHIEPLAADGSLLPEDAPIPGPPASSRWLLIYAFPKDSPRFHLFYWGKQLTPDPVGFSAGGLSLPPPPAVED